MTLSPAIQGGVRFGLVSILVFLYWALLGRQTARTLGEPGFYLVCALLFIALSALALKALAPNLSSLRFFLLFSGAFLAYAVTWSLAWFAMPNQGGAIVGAIVGPMVLTGVFCLAAKRWALFLKLALLLCLLHAAGYWLGEILYKMWGTSFFREHFSRDARGLLSKLCWGAAYGAGFGAGLGWQLDELFGGRNEKPLSPSP